MILCEYYYTKLGKSKLIKYFNIEYFETEDCKKLFGKLLWKSSANNYYNLGERIVEKKQYEMISYFFDVFFN